MNENNPLAKLNYIKSNFPNIFVHYGDFKSIRLDKKSSAYLTQGNIEVFCRQKDRSWKQYFVSIENTAELKNETPYKMYVKLNDSVLTDINLTDCIIYIKLGEEKNAN